MPQQTVNLRRKLWYIKATKLYIFRSIDKLVQWILQKMNQTDKKFVYLWVMKLFKNILPLVLTAFFALVLFSCQKGGEPVPYGQNDGSGKVCTDVSGMNQRGDQSGETGSTGDNGSSTENGTKGGNSGGGTNGGDDTVIGGDDNEDDDDVEEGFDLGGDPPKTGGDDDPSGNGGV